MTEGPARYCTKHQTWDFCAPEAPAKAPAGKKPAAKKDAPAKKGGKK